MLETKVQQGHVLLLFAFTHLTTVHCLLIYAIIFSLMLFGWFIYIYISFFLWEFHTFWFMSTFSGAQVGLKTRSWCMYIAFFFLWCFYPILGSWCSLKGLCDYSLWTHHTQYDSGRVVSPVQGPLPDKIQHSQETNIHACGGIWTHNLSYTTHTIYQEVVSTLSTHKNTES